MSNLTNKNGIRLIDQYNEAITIEDAIALATGEALPMWKCGSDYDMVDENGVIWNTVVDAEEYQALIEEYSVTIEDIKAKYYEIKEEMLWNLEDDLTEAQSAIMSEDEKFALIAEDIPEALKKWQGSFYRQMRIVIAQEYSCPVHFWQNLKCAI